MKNKEGCPNVRRYKDSDDKKVVKLFVTSRTIINPTRKLQDSKTQAYFLHSKWSKEWFEPYGKFRELPLQIRGCRVIEQKFTGYNSSDFKECILILHDLYLSKKGGGLQAVREKYKQHNFKCVANMPSPQEMLVSYFEDVKVLESKRNLED